MILVSCERDGERSYGALVEGTVVDLRRAEPRLPETLLQLLDSWRPGRTRSIGQGPQ